MEDLTGTIEFSGMRPLRSVKRFATKQIRKWIQAELPTLAASPTRGTYRMVIDREQGAFPLFRCQIGVSIDGWEWQAIRYARDLQEAVTAAIRVLRVRKEECA